MSHTQILTIFDQARFPRVSGDEPPADLQWLDSQKFSPRERG